MRKRLLSTKEVGNRKGLNYLQKNNEAESEVREMENIKIICNVVATLCICVVSFGILYEYCIRARREKKMLQDIAKRLEALEEQN